MSEIVLAQQSYGTANTPFVPSAPRSETGWHYTSGRPVILVRSEEPRRVTIDWLVRTPNSVAGDIDDQQLSEIVDGLQQLVAARAFAVLANLMRTFKPEHLPPAASLALLRITYPARRDIDSWQPFLRRVRAVFKSNGLDTASLLRGLG